MRPDETAIGDTSTMLFPDDQDEGIQGFSLEAPATVFVTEIEQGSFIWERGSTPKERTYQGTLNVKGRFAVFVPEGQQENIWSRLGEKIDFVVKDLRTGAVQKRKGSQGGGYLTRMGISAHMERVYPDIDYSSLPCETIHSEYFNVEVFDLLPVMPVPDTVLEIHTEYMGFTSAPVRVKVRLQED
jgi:hypothetical protein